jgi:hypothetical protein
MVQNHKECGLTVYTPMRQEIGIQDELFTFLAPAFIALNPNVLLSAQQGLPTKEQKTALSLSTKINVLAVNYAHGRALTEPENMILIQVL